MHNMDHIVHENDNDEEWKAPEGLSVFFKINK